MFFVARPDRFTFDLERADWLFTLALGLAAGLVLSGAWRLARRDGRGADWRAAAATILAGTVLGVASVAATIDAAPVTPIEMNLKPYLSVAAAAAALMGAFALGVAGGFVPGAVLGLWRGRVRARMWLVAGAQVVIVAITAGGVLLLTDETISGPRHPAGTETGRTVGATRLSGAFEMPTGLALAADGTLFVTDLFSGSLTVLEDGVPRVIALGLGEGAQVFHVALHPEWPAEPYAYVSADYVDGGVKYLQVLRARTEGAAAVEQVIRALPMTQPGKGNHYGSALAFCGEFLFLSTGDTDTVSAGLQSALSARAQLPTTGEGKVMRYRLEGTEVVPAGVVGSDPPVFAMGFRNPFAMACEPATGLPLVADNGLHSNDQVRRVAAGSNHEWPLSFARNRLSEPVFDSGDMTFAPTGVAVRDRPGGPELIFSGFKSGGVYVVRLGEAGLAEGDARLLHQFDEGVLSLALDEDGCIVVGAPGGLWRIDETGCG